MPHAADDAFWFYLPALVGNVGIYLTTSLVGGGFPLDLYGKIGGKRLLGRSRTLLGTVGFLVFPVLTGVLQHRAAEGLYLGMGAQFGCLVNSLLKRALGLRPGQSFFPVDQTDYILGASLFYVSAHPLDRGTFLWGLLTGFVLHLLVNLFRKPFEIFLRGKTKITSDG